MVSLTFRFQVLSFVIMHHLFPCTVGETLVFLQKKTRSTLQIFSVDDSLTSRLGKYSFVKQIATYVDTIGTIQNVPYKNIQLQIHKCYMAIIGNYSSAQQTVLSHIIAICLAVIVSIQAHLLEFVLQTDIANKEITGFFVSLQNPFFTASDQLSRSKQSLQFFVPILV